MEQMTEAGWREFVSAGTRTGKLGVPLADGAPHVTPIWFVLDGPDLVFTTHSETLKGKALLRDPRAVICVDDDQPPFAFVTIRGETTVSEDPAELGAWATIIGGRYMGPDRAEEFGARNGVPGELLVRLRMSKVIAYGNLAG
ncbi:MAG TPA: PPOX class F420-dependent oxidoreductase [Actinomadura sp.]|jgi:PPOX class probable F420-dependent enzyme|nr:PPOX class F420-dependent oxidoreductase [Actinomadura sp.]